MKRVSSIAFVFCVVLIAKCSAGPIIIDPENPHSFRYASGERFFPMGDTAYYLMAHPTNVIARYIDVRREHKFNFVRVMAMCAGFWPFGGTVKSPDYTTLNEAAMQKWDWVFDYAALRGMNIELILWGYGIEGGEGLWAREADQTFWVRNLVERFKSRHNLFLWTIANEFERYPDGRYEYDEKDVEWARRIAGQVREIDPVHPIGCHPSVWITDQDPPGAGPRPFARYKDFQQRRPQVVWPLWDGSAIDLNITQNNEGVQARSWGEIKEGRRGLTYHTMKWEGVDYPADWTAEGWKLEGAGLEDCLAEDFTHGKPVLDSEFGYQHERGYDQEMNHATRQTHAPSSVRKKAWKIAVSGGYFAAGFESAAVRNFTLGDIENFRPQQLETLYTFFTSKTEYWKMTPHPQLVASHNVMLASPGKEYIAYFPRGGTNHVKITAGNFKIEWLHPESGRCSEQHAITVGDEGSDFVPPERIEDDWVLHLWK